MDAPFNLKQYSIIVSKIHRNLPSSQLYEHAHNYLNLRERHLGFDGITSGPGVPFEILCPRHAREDIAYNAATETLARLLVGKFKRYEDGNSTEVRYASSVASPAGLVVGDDNLGDSGGLDVIRGAVRPNRGAR